MIPIVEHTYTNEDGEKRHITRIFDNGDVIFNEDGESLKCSGAEWTKWCGKECQSAFDAHFVPAAYMPKAAGIKVAATAPDVKSEFNKDADWQKVQQIKKSPKKS